MTQYQVLLLMLAILVAVIVWRFPRKPVHLQYAVGVMTLAGRFTELIPGGVRLPFVFADLFHNALDSQDDVVIELLQHRDGALVTIDTVTLDGLPKRPVGMMDLEIRLVVSRRKEMRMIVQSREAGFVKNFGPYTLDS